jgi:4-hydroxy-4-methyl-2-oxoglutarate aldolase
MEIGRSAVDELLQFSTPSVLNGLKRLGVHPSRLESLDRLAIRCTSPALGRRVGFAATRKVSTSTAGPTRAPSSPSRQADEHILTVPEPRILVAENVGEWKGPVCIWGEVAANLYMAMGCTGGVTNGPVRDIDEMEQVGFQTFAGGPGVGGGFVDVIEVGEPVVVGGVTIASGDLLHADRHGVVKVPIELAAALPDAIRAIEEKERRVIEVCRSPEFSLDGFAAAWSSDQR